MTYTIGEFAKLTNFSIDTLRYYEKLGIILPNRDQNNRRVFCEKDLVWIDFISKLKQTGMKLQDIKKYAELRYQGAQTVEERLALLFQQSVSLQKKKEEIDTHIAFLETKITIYQEMLAEQNQHV
ncbi:MerR family transcriptional regulator [Enterococcus florum]|uniref:MerR family transcriptional regulator n=1 Tax=Enterococcus florum TaxID=2480627 RepID=A0A4P5P322_9ENTE|nr:MerR family transcriptional regulator [Enterococcus florum]GCF92115.1 MerR family transcriptional regulator [Enterococcus florum]